MIDIYRRHTIQIDLRRELEGAIRRAVRIPSPMKLARVNANDFQTVIPYFDARTRVSFGQVRQQEEK